FFRKLAQGLGPSLVVLLMGALGYDGALKAEQPFWVAENMKWLVAGLYTFSAIVMFLSITFIYNLNKKKVAQMTAELEERRAANTAEEVAEEVATETTTEEVATETATEEVQAEEKPEE
ncbi:MAG: hypothetical protein IKM16_04105, partial [Clostridia bacterium]|nr:hypothetical protein [Clostridia bacterium]